MKVERTAGFVTKVGDLEVMELSLPDWSLSYIEFPEGEISKYRTVLTRREGIRIRQVTPTRIYFEDM